MITTEELTSWRVAAIEGKLPNPARADRWQPLRAGLVNLWEYDAAEVWYADGRMQLQGANESGKSTLLTLTTLLLLAGDISAHNIDTLGQDGKRFRYYVEPTDHPLDRRDTSAQKNRGWAWLEFGNGAEFFTLLLFAEARRADGILKVSWCTLTGQARVRSGLSLVTAGFAAEPSQFKDVPGFMVHPSGTAYREVIARTLYDTEEPWLNQLIRILRVIRTPQIGTRLDLRFLTEAFRTALPPIAEDEINQLADGWEQLQRLRDERDEAERALAIVTDFSRRSWRPWADSVVRAAADPVISVTSALTTITRDAKTASDKVGHLKDDMAELDAHLAEKEAERQTADARRETLQDSARYQDAVSAAANAKQLAEWATAAETTASRSEKRAQEARSAVGPAEENALSAAEDFDSAERKVVTSAAKVTAQAQEAGLAELTATYLPGRDIARLRQGGRLRTSAAESAVKLMNAHAATLAVLEAASVKNVAAQSRLARAQSDSAQREADVIVAIRVTTESVAAWAAGLDERIRPATELVEAWMSLVADLIDAPAPASVLPVTIHRAHLVPARRPHAERQAALRHDMAENVKGRRSLQASLTTIEEERDPSPREPEFWARRERPEGVTPAGAPFWRLVETLDNAPAERLEAALDAAGLLQAWVTPDGAYLEGRDGNETVWTMAADRGVPAPPVRSSLRAVLRPADDAGRLAEVVERLLRSVGYDNGYADSGAAGAGSGISGSSWTAAGAVAQGVAVSADGRWRHAELTGTAAAAPDGPRLLGAAARATDRRRRAAQIRDQIAAMESAHERLAIELQTVAGLLSALDVAGEQLPTDTGVVSAVLGAREAAKWVTERAAEAEEAATAEHAAREAADGAAAEVARHCDDHRLPRTRAEADGLLEALATYLELLGQLDADLRPVEPLRRALAGARSNVDLLAATAETAEKDANKDRETALDLRTKSEAAREALSHGAQEILAEAERLKRESEGLGGLLTQLGKKHEELTGQLMTAQTVLGQVEAKRMEAETARELAVIRWWSCMDTGLPSLREVPDPAARHVTAALESARAARSAISVRDWPDSDRQDLQAQRVQARWTAMVDAGADLRSRLEPLGGRSLRFLSPGDGREDFPGGVELTVDSSGAALPPPTAAVRLSDLLVRLQEDYDEELTRTIDELLGSTFIEHLRDRLAEAEGLREDINAKLAQNPTAISGITLRLNRIPVSEERAANDVLGALERDFDLLPKPTQERIRTFLAERITSAQEQALASGDPRWRNRLAEILDYRRWFDLRLEYRTPRSANGDGTGAGWRTLDRGDHGLLSGGAKVVTLMQPFIAALHAMYDQAGTGPRMLWLDEAFGGVDGTNRASMFRLLDSCDLDWLIAGPGIIANSAAVPVVAIYEVRRAPRPWPGVSLELAVWAGNELTNVLTPDPADLRDVAVVDAASDDALFAEL